MTRKALGKGLSSLIHEAEPAATTVGSEAIPLSLIDPNPSQPRTAFPEESLKELADSIRSSGIIQPVLVRKAGGRYQLVVGERRWRAAGLAGLDQIPVIIREVNNRESLELALAENLLRDDLNPIEVAQAYSRLQADFELTQEEVASRLGVNRVSVANTLRLLQLPQTIQDLVSSKQLSAGHARALLGLDNPDEQLNLAKETVARGLSVREIEERVRRQQERQGKGSVGSRAPDRQAPELDPNTKAAVLELERALGTRVRITGDGKRGRIEISYFSAEDLQRIYDLLTRSGSLPGDN